MAELIIGPALFLGAIIGAYEAFIIHRDVNVAMYKLGHMFHAFTLAIVFCFASMNTVFVLSLLPVLKEIMFIGNPHVLRVAIGVIAALKIHAVSRVIQKGVVTRGMSETWFHSFLIGGLIVAAPYVYPFIAPALPSWVNW